MSEEENINDRMADFLDDEEIEEIIIEEKETRDLSDYRSASREELVGAIGRSVDAKEIVIPIDHVKKIALRIWMRELSVNEILMELESFYKQDKKTGEIIPQFRKYYAAMFNKIVERTEPPMVWKNAKKLGEKFLYIIFEHFPNPLKISQKLSEDEQKN